MIEISVLELHEKIQKDKNINLIDVREYVEYANGRAEKARHIPLSEVGKLHKELGTSETIFLISKTGKRSSEALDMLRVIGFNDLINVRGGFEAWKLADLPFEKDDDAPWKIERQSRLLAGGLVFSGVIFGLFLHWTFVLISAGIGLIQMAEALSKTEIIGQALIKMPWNQGHFDTPDQA